VPRRLLRQVAIDAVLELREITERAVSDLLTLALSATAPAAVLAARNVEVAGPPAVWMEKHLR